MPDYIENDEKGDIGIDLVSLRVKQEFSWIFREQTKNDLGIDGHVEIVKDSREGTGRLLAAQIKCGPSYLSSEEEDCYIYYGKIKHLEYWLLHSLPVLIILCDEQSGTCYWEEVTRANIIRTEKAWKIRVPKKQTLTKKWKNDLTLIAGMPQHPDIVNLALFKFLSEKYHKSSNTGRLDICPLLHEPHDFMYFTCLAEFERTGQYVYVAHHYDIYKEFTLDRLNEFIDWRTLNMGSCGHKEDNPLLYIFVISEKKENLALTKEIINRVKDHGHIEIFRILYKHSPFPRVQDGRMHHLTELDHFNKEIYFYD
ncbi:DUF4365 domain-containing protein [Oxalobacteraceae bacterium]|nr:DUF4365 domain-containing protein [Oxalobacteraceae bacterium]